MECPVEQSSTDTMTPLINEIAKNILSKTEGLDGLQNDFLFLVILVLFIENGFLPIENGSVVVDSPKSIDLELLSKWKSSAGTFEASFALLGFNGIPVKCIMSPLGAIVLINLVITDLNSETYSICLPVTQYVVSPQVPSIPILFHDLNHLSITLKDKILTAVKSRIISHCGYPSASLLGLPEEVLLNILLYLPIGDLINLSRTCKIMNMILENQSLWCEVYKRDFNDESQSQEVDWKKLYKEKYLRQQDKKLRQSYQAAGTMHDYMDYADFISYIDNPMWDVIT